MKDKPKSFNAIAGGALAALLLVGTFSSVTAFAAASPSSSPTTPAAVVSQDTKTTDTAALAENEKAAENDLDNVQEEVVETGDNNNEATEKETAKAEDPAKETTEKAALTAQAKITELQAIDVAKAANIGSTAVKASLESENGKAVYEVKLTSADGKSLEVKVDAISGAVIAEADGNAEYEG